MQLPSGRMGVAWKAIMWVERFDLRIAGVDAANANSKALYQAKSGMDYSKSHHNTSVVHLAFKHGIKPEIGISQIDSTNPDDDIMATPRRIGCGTFSLP